MIRNFIIATLLLTSCLDRRTNEKNLTEQKRDSTIEKKIPVSDIPVTINHLGNTQEVGVRKIDTFQIIKVNELDNDSLFKNIEFHSYNMNFVNPVSFSKFSKVYTRPDTASELIFRTT